MQIYYMPRQVLYRYGCLCAYIYEVLYQYIWLKQKQQHYRNMIEKIMTDKMYAVLPDFNSAKRKAKTHAAMIPTITGLIHLSVEM